VIYVDLKKEKEKLIEKILQKSLELINKEVDLNEFKRT